jgi:Mn2+/Fe2+ NRAMP family transporter
VLLMVHPPISQIAHHMFVPGMPKGAPLSEVMLLIIAIVGTTVAPWQLFFQQSYVIDKRITPRFMAYEKADLWIGIALVVVGAVAMVTFTAATFAGKPEMGQFVDAGAVADGIAKYIGATPSVLFSIALIDASIIGAAAVSLSTAYAIGDVLSLNHSLHRKPTEAKTFYAVYAILIVISAALVLLPNAPLGIITNAVQTLAGILLPGASVFLLLLCNDKAVLGPWVNKPVTNLFTGAVVAVLVLLSIILTASVLYPSITSRQIIAVLVGGSVIAALGAMAIGVFHWRNPSATVPDSLVDKAEWRMPPLKHLPPAQMSLRRRIWLGVLRAYLAAALILAIVKVVEMIITKS